MTAPVMALSDTGGEGFSGHPRPGALLELNALAFGAQQGGDTVIPGTAKHLLEALPALAKKYREVYLVGLLQRGDLATRETLGDRPSGSSNYVGQYPDGKTRLVVHQPWNGVEADRNGGYADPAKARTYATGSTFASANPRAVDPAWGTLADVDVAKEIMKAESGRLIVDVVPNHIGIDNLWVDEFTTIHDAQEVPTKVPNWKATVHIDLMSLLTPEELASLSDEDLFSMGTVKKKISPKSYERLSYALYERGMEGDVLRYAVYYATPGDKKSRVLIAHGKDPYQIAWLDSFQLDFTNPIARQYVFDTIKFWADKGISVRTDMSHLLTRGEFKKLWYPHMSWQDFEQAWPREFWNEVVEKIVSTTPDFTLTMEGYQGLDFLKQLDPRVRVYEKGGIFDNVRARNIGWLRNYLQNGIRPNAVHFLQNHDEEGMWDKGNEFMKAATALIMTIPGVPFIHEPQRHGQDRFKIQVLLPNQRPPVPGMEKFMDAMADIAALPLFREGSMQVIETNTNLLVYTREYRGEKAVVVINLTDQPQSGNFVVPNPSPGKDLLLNDEYFPFKHDKNSNAAQSYRRTPQDLERDHGLIVNLAPGDAHIFMMTDVPSVSASAAQLPPNASAVAATLLETYVVVEKLLGWFFKLVYKLDLTGEWWAGENEQKNFPAVRFSREIAAPVLESLYLLDVVSRMYKENWQITYRNAAQKPAEVRKSLVDDLHARNQQTVTMVKGFAQSHDNALPFETVLQRLTLPGLAAYDVAYMSLIGIPFMPVGIAYAWAAMAGYASLFGVHRAFNRSDEGRTMPATIGSAKSAPKSATRRKILKYSLGAGLLSLLPEVTAVPVVASSGGTAHQPVFTAAERGAGATWISGQKTKLGRTDIAQSYEITPEGGIPADVKTFLDGYANTYDLALSGMQLLFNPARTAADITGVQNILNYLTNTLSYNAYMVPYRSNKENTIFTGEVAWAGMLAAQYKALYPDDKASDLLMKRIDTYLLRSDMLFTDNGYQCIKGGPTMSWASTEHNLDTLAYLTMRRKLLQSVAGQEQHCADLRALEVKIALWLRNRAFNGICFNRGANDTMFAADTSSFGVMVLMALQADDPALFEGTGLSQINLETLLHAADIAFDSTTGLYTFGAGAAPTAVASHSGQAAVGSTGNAIRGVGGYDIAGVDRGVTGQAVVVNAPPSTEFSAQMALAKRLLGTADNGDAVLQKVREHLYTSGGVRYVPLGWAGWNDIGNYFAVSYPAMSPTIFAIFLADRGVLVNPFRLVNEATLNPQFKIFLPAIKSGMSWLPIGYGLVRWIARRLAPGVSKNKSTPIVVPPEEVLPPAQDTAQTNTPRGPDEGAFSVAATLESSRLLEKIVRQIFSIFKGVPPAFLMAAVRPIDECFIAPFVEL
ncbi:MAG: hypothetical protein NTU66_03645, partial [Elusimicrobia bacterium]|nr:hypothetical protein [Elusimicrobiota bacterium]